MSNTGWAVVIIVLVILVGGGWWYYSSQAPAVPATTNTTAVTNGTDTGNNAAGTSAGAGVDVNAGTNAANTATIHYTSSGFSPKTVTIQKGQSVTWVNDTSGPMWVASDQHPAHTAYDGTDRTTHCAGDYTGPTPLDECQTGSSFTFVFQKTGTFNFHNHSAAQFEGAVTVQ